MSVTYRTLYFDSPDHEEVSNEWFVLLYNIHKHGDYTYVITEGHRTMKRQQELFDEKGQWSPSNPTGAAKPTKNAPHIRTGRFDHAIDVAKADQLITGAARRGVTLHRPIPQEPWHLEADAKELKRYYDRKSAAVWAELRKLHGPTTKPKLPPAASKISEKGVRMIASFEGGQSKDGLYHPYKNKGDVWTIGYGHTEGVGPKSKPLSKTAALNLLHKDLNNKYAPSVAKAAKAAGVKFSQNEFDAMTSAVYNLGPGILDKGRTMGNALRNKNREWMAAAFLVYNKDGNGKVLAGLNNRRKAESKLFLTK